MSSASQALAAQEHRWSNAGVHDSPSVLGIPIPGDTSGHLGSLI
jgi:hypothetical protein